MNLNEYLIENDKHIGDVVILNSVGTALDKVSGDTFPMMVDNTKFLNKNRLNPDVFTFLFVGRLVAHKNAEALIEKFNAYFSDKNAVLRIVGTGEEEVYLKSKYESKQVFFVGKKSRIP